jgi:stage V sporulation protein AD
LIATLEFCFKIKIFAKILTIKVKNEEIYGVHLTSYPAAVDTITTHFNDRKLSGDYFDMVVTGDLGKIGYDIAKEQIIKNGIDIRNRYYDCGVMIYKEEQDTHAGGSGCGCCASVFSGYIFNMLKKGEIDRVLLVATGALMSTTSAFQGNTIPGIAHAVAIERVKK